MSGDDRTTDDDDAESDATVRSGSMAASAIGLAFSVPADVDACWSRRPWGRYERTPSEMHETDRAAADHLATACRAAARSRCRLDAEGSESLVPDPAARAWSSGTRCGTGGRGGSWSCRWSTGSRRRRRRRTRRGCTRWG